MMVIISIIFIKFTKFIKNPKGKEKNSMENVMLLKTVVRDLVFAPEVAANQNIWGEGDFVDHEIIDHV